MMVFERKVIMENILKEELKRIKYAIKLNVFAYMFIVSNYEQMRNYFSSQISVMEEIQVVDSLVMTRDEFNKKFMSNKGLLYIENRNNIELDDNSLYLSLVLKRDFLWEKGKTIIVICSEEIAKYLLSQNASLSSTSRFYYIDDIIKDNEKPKKLIK